MDEIKEVKKIWNGIVDECSRSLKHINVGSKRRREVIIEVDKMLCQLFEPDSTRYLKEGETLTSIEIFTNGKKVRFIPEPKLDNYAGGTSTNIGNSESRLLTVKE